MVHDAPSNEPVAHRRAGLVLLDEAGRTVYLNKEAVEILSFSTSGNGDTQPSAGTVASRLGEGVGLRGTGSGESSIYVSGHRRYTCRSFRLAPGRRNGTGPVTALLLERIGSHDSQVARARSRFRLTAREAEATELLVQGLTNKEIAAQMGVTPNTIKAFLRTVMLKMGTSTRAGVVGRVMEVASAPIGPSGSASAF